MSRSLPTGVKVCVLLAALVALPMVHPYSAARRAIDRPHRRRSNLAVRPVIDGLNQPIAMAFLGPSHFLVLEKASGRVLRVTRRHGAGLSSLDLPVNSRPNAACWASHFIRIFRETAASTSIWTESSTGADSTALADVPLLGNRVDRFEWNGTTLTHDAQHHPVACVPGRRRTAAPRQSQRRRDALRARRQAVHRHRRRRPPRLAAEPACGPTAECPGRVVADDQFGGPRPDNAHLTGVILRLNDDGSTPERQPILQAGAAIWATRRGGTSARSSRTDCATRSAWTSIRCQATSGWKQNGDDTFTELDRVEPGMNGGWVQIMGPVSRLAQFKAIETSTEFFGLQQIRWPPTLIADNAAELALAARDDSRRALQRSGVQLEVRSRAGRARRSSAAAPSGRSTPATCSSAPRATCSKAGTSSASS